MNIDGDTFEDCPALVVGYLCEPDRIEVRYVSPAHGGTPAGDDQGQSQEEARPEHQVRDAAGDEIVGREVADAWARIVGRLAAHAPTSYAALRSGVGEKAVEAFEDGLDVRGGWENSDRIDAHYVTALTCEYISRRERGAVTPGAQQARQSRNTTDASRRTRCAASAASTGSSTALRTASS
ncbi:hypothetical protein OG818_25955 [Streptomyces virginiae]|uniref:hypothetical protein n=1 Tax=Streptomyces virginiae TaxID=1961 RepID=UPI00225BCA0B|nr:hypothetical protein [Streptomyces virginiae]MCX4719185.1 hypothetical protein [Streptomyces virginiae]